MRVTGAMTMKRIWVVLGLVCCLSFVALGRPGALAVQESSKSADAATDVSGMYTFLREGEFVQLTVDDGRLSGYISRFGDSESDKGQFIDQFFDKTSLVGDRLTFTTKTIHGVWYEFNGRVTIVPDKRPTEEGYRVMKGTLVQHTTDANRTEKAMQRQVEFKQFPVNLR